MLLPKTPAISLYPFKNEFRNYGFRFFTRDFLAAIAVAFMTIPQSIAYSLLAGLPPTAGLFSAIFGTIFTASLGSSRHLISGPSTGVAILIQTSIADLLYNYFEIAPQAAIREELILHLLGQMVLLIGIIQIAAGFLNVSKLLQFVSRPVMLGYFMGIMFAIIVNQLYYFLGVPSSGPEISQLYRAWRLIVQLPLLNWKTTLVGCVSLALFLLLKKRQRWKMLPDALFMLVLASVGVFLLHFWLQDSITPTLQFFKPTEHPIPQLYLPLIDFRVINQIFPAATAIAFLAILEVYSISRNFAAKSGQQVQVNQDIFGLGCANFLLSLLVGAMPASGSATRTTVNYNAKAKTRLAAILSGLFIALFLAFGWPLVQHIPLASLAALLIATAPVLVDFKEVRFAIRTTREDRWVFLLTFISCLIFSLDIAFFIGIVISIATYLRRSSIPHLVEYAFNTKGRLMAVIPKEDPHRKVRIIGIAGDLYFASADVFQSALYSVAEDPNVKAIVLRLNNVYHVDASMCLAIRNLKEALDSKDCQLVISGLTEEVWSVFHKAGLIKEIGMENLYFTDESNPQFSTWKACLHAQELVHRKGVSL